MYCFFSFLRCYSVSCYKVSLYICNVTIKRYIFEESFCNVIYRLHDYCIFKITYAVYLETIVFKLILNKIILFFYYQEFLPFDYFVVVCLF